jgi:FtsP/CotA-like multicopper oxidase with cupredoxin domain
MTRDLEAIDSCETPSPEEDEVLTEGTEQARMISNTTLARLRMPLISMVCLVVGFLGGLASKFADTGRPYSSQNLQIHDYFTDPTDLGGFGAQSPNLPALSMLPLRLVNVSRLGDGWAPWQFAVSGPEDYKDKSQKWVNMNGVWTIVIDPDANGRQPRLNINTRFRVAIRNKLHEPALMHWHGFQPPNSLDGIPWISSMPIQENHTQYYDFVIYHRGFNWAHSHFGHQLEAGLYAPVIIKDHPKDDKAFGLPQEIMMVIYDGHWRWECAYTQALYPVHCPTGGFDGWDQYQILVNGHDARSGLAREVDVKSGKPVRLRILMAGGGVYNVSFGGLKGEIIATDGMHVRRGRNGVKVNYLPVTPADRYDVLLDIPKAGGRYDVMAQRIHMDKPVPHAERGVLVLKTPNAPFHEVPSGYAPDLVNHFSGQWFKDFTAKLQAKNGLRDPQRAPDVHHIIRLTGAYEKNSGEWRPAFDINGKGIWGGDENRGMRVWPAVVWCKVVPGQADWDVSHTVANMVFCQGESIVSNFACDHFECADGKSGDADGRCLPDNTTENVWAGVRVSDCDQWAPQPNTFRYNPDSPEVCYGDRVWITYVTETKTAGHPMHLHGTHQQLIAVNGTPVDGALKDTWFVPIASNLTVAFDAYNPGEWLLHCHIGMHTDSGMVTTVRYVTGGRCLDKAEEEHTWKNTDPLPPSEWTQDWKTLWEKKDPTQDKPVYPFEHDTQPASAR